MSTAVPTCLRYSVLFAVAVLSPWLALAADSTPPTSKVLELPKLTINDDTSLPELESWRYARIPGFEVLSNASDSTTQKLLADFQKFQRGVRLAWPAPAKPLAASTLVLCGRDRKFDGFIPENLRHSESPVPSLFLRNREQIAIVVDLEARRVMINDPAALLAANAPFVEYDIDAYRQLYREYVRYLLSQGDATRPAWLEEGLAQIVMDIEMTGDFLILGKIETYRGSVIGGSPFESEDSDVAAANGIVGEQPFNMVLQRRALLPFDRFFGITAEDEEARHPLGNSLWAKQAYAFVHYCLFGEKQQYKDALATFVTRLAREPATEELFKQCFHVNYAEMAKQLRTYILNTRHKYQKYSTKEDGSGIPATITLSDASAAQVGLLKGDAFRLAAHPEAAFNEYRMAYVRGGRDAALLAGLADTQTDPALARRFNDEAVRSGVNRPSTYVNQARMRLAEFKADPGPDGKLTPTQMTAVLTPLFKARSLPPPLPETYELIAEAWAASSVPAKPEHLGVLDEGVRRFPGDSELIHRTAKLYEQAGLVPTALAITRLGLRFATDPAAKTRLEELQAALSAKVSPAPPVG